jgi:hypothetical protein
MWLLAALARSRGSQWVWNWMVCVAGGTHGEWKKFLSLPEIESQLSNAQQLHTHWLKWLSYTAERGIRYVWLVESSIFAKGNEEDIERWACVPLPDKIRYTYYKSSLVIGTVWNGTSFIGIELLRADTLAMTYKEHASDNSILCSC